MYICSHFSETIIYYTAEDVYMTVRSIRTALVLYSNETLGVEQAAASAGISRTQFERLAGKEA